MQEGSSCGLPFSLLVPVLDVYWFLSSLQVPVHGEKAIRDYGVLAAELGHWSLQATRCLARLRGNPKSLEWWAKNLKTDAGRAWATHTGLHGMWLLSLLMELLSATFQKWKSSTCNKDDTHMLICVYKRCVHIKGSTQKQESTLNSRAQWAWQHTLAALALSP